MGHGDEPKLTGKWDRPYSGNENCCRCSDNATWETGAAWNEYDETRGERNLRDESRYYCDKHHSELLEKRKKKEMAKRIQKTKKSKLPVGQARLSDVFKIR